MDKQSENHEGKTMPQKNQDQAQKQGSKDAFGKKHDDRFMKDKDSEGESTSEEKPERDQDQASRQFNRPARDLNTNVR